MSNDLYLSFDYIFEIGKKIYDELMKNPANESWVQQIKEQYNDNCEYPPDIYNKIRDALIRIPQLYEPFQGIVSSNEDGIENFYNSIFFPSNDEEEDDAQSGNELEDEDIDNVISDIEDNSPDTTPASLTAETLEKRQNKQIDQVSNTLFISKDLAFLLLKKFNWNADHLIVQWLEKKDAKKNILDSLHVPEEMIHEPLTLKNIGKGECEVCYNDQDDLYQLYCGHTLCKSCWQGEISAQLTQGLSSIVCRADSCNSEIMLSDISKFCGEEKAKSYIKFLLEDQIFRDNKLIHCPGVDCQQVLTIESVGYCGVATCPKCGKRICWRCQKDAHAPLSCEKLDEWKKLQEEMLKLSRSQKRWENRELRLIDYRRSHMQEIVDANKAFNNHLKADHQIKSRNEVNEINRLKQNLKKIKDEKIKQYTLKKIREKENEHKLKEKEREQELKQVAEDQNEYMNAVQSTQNAKFYFNSFRESQELRALEKFCTSDEEFIERMTKKCPNCKTNIIKNGGCNCMTCSICHFQFCWLCGADWKTHGDHFACNKYDGGNSNIDDDDDASVDDSKDDAWATNDKRYYLPPMNYELRANFARFNHYFKHYQSHLDAQRLEKRNRDQYRETLLQAWEDIMSKETINNLVDKVYRAIDTARSVLIYSYPTAFFMDSHSTAFFMFEMCQGNLEISNEKLVGMVERFSGQKPEDFEKFTDMNHKYIEAILREADNYSC